MGVCNGFREIFLSVIEIVAFDCVIIHSGVAWLSIPVIRNHRLKVRLRRQPTLVLILALHQLLNLDFFSKFHLFLIYSEFGRKITFITSDIRFFDFTTILLGNFSHFMYFFKKGLPGSLKSKFQKKILKNKKRKHCDQLIG
jgi:hypothetical protein